MIAENSKCLNPLTLISADTEIGSCSRTTIAEIHLLKPLRWLVREIDILRRVAEGSTDREIAQSHDLK